MGMNLHTIVRGAINGVNPDRVIAWKQSTGSAKVGNVLAPQYAASVNIRAQIQPVTSGDIRKFDFLQGQGVFKAVYCFGAIDGIVRAAAKGGDLLVFNQVPNVGAPRTWLVKAQDEEWAPDVAGWSRVIVVMQLDPNNP